MIIEQFLKYITSAQFYFLYKSRGRSFLGIMSYFISWYLQLVLHQYQIDYWKPFLSWYHNYPYHDRKRMPMHLDILLLYNKKYMHVCLQMHRVAFSFIRMLFLLLSRSVNSILLLLSVLLYSTFCASQYTINKLFDMILYHDTIMKWSWSIFTSISYHNGHFNQLLLL